MSFKVYDTVTPMALTHAAFVFGGYPQVPFDEAVRNVRKKIEAMGHDELRPLTLWLLGRKEFGKGYSYFG